MLRWVRLIVLLALLPASFINKSSAQDLAPGYTVRHWTVKDGLPSDNIHDILKTSDGYMWFRTIEGLVRFDGQSFIVFNNSNTTAFQHSEIFNLTNTYNNEFWFDNGTANNPRFIQYKDGRFEHRPFNHKLALSTSFNRRFELSAQGELWVAGEEQVFKFSNEQFTPVFADEINSAPRGFFMADHAIWISAENGFYQVLGDSVSYTEYDNRALRSFAVDSEGVIWGIIGENLARLDNTSSQYFKLPADLRTRFPRLEFNQQEPNQLIVTTSPFQFIFKDGLFQKVSDEKSYYQQLVYAASEINSQKLSGWHIAHGALFHQKKFLAEADMTLMSPLFLDENDQAWLGTREGLYKFGISLFNSFERSADIKNIYSLFEDHEGAIWGASMWDGVHRLKDNRIELITESSFPRVFSFYEENNGNIWLGTAHGIRIWNRNSGSITSLPSPFDRQRVQVKVIQQNGHKNLWIGSRDGLYNYEKETNAWNKLPVENGVEIQIEQLFQFEGKEVWIGTRHNGLYTIKNDTLVAFPENDQLLDIRIRSIHKDKEGILWVGLNGGGLHRIELKPDRLSSTSITKYIPENGLLGSVIHTIMEDDYDRVWMSSNQGIFWVPKQQLNDVALGKVNRIHPIIYQEEDGLPGNEANGGAQTPGITTRDGAFWFAMLNGITRVHPKEVNDLSFSFPSIIESVSSRDSTWISGYTTISIPKRDRSIRIKYTAFNYSVKPEDIRFSYKLNGQDEEWIYAGAERSVSFTNLKAGMYTFELRAGMGNTWDDAHSSSISFTVEPFFYETSWFYGFCILLGCSILIGLIIWGNRKLEFQRKQYDLEVKAQEEAISENEAFLNKFQEYVEERISEPSIKVSELAAAMNTSQRQLFRTTKSLTGFTPHQFVREIRLKKAQQLLENQQVGTISEVAHSVGFSTPFYFSKLFEERFEYHPSELINK